jgi:hypothetical protein
LRAHRQSGVGPAFLDERQHPCHLASNLAEPRRIVLLSECQLEAQVERLLLGFDKVVRKFIIVQLSERTWAGHLYLDLFLMSASHKSRLYRQLLDSPFHGGARKGLCDSSQFEHDPTGFYDCDPKLWVALARTHAGLGRLGRNRLIREHADPHFAAAANMTGHSDTGCLNLTSADPTGFESLDAVIAKRDFRTTFGKAAHPATLLLAVLYLAGHQHGC